MTETATTPLQTATPAPLGRIWFAGNPWPQGHRIATFRMGGNLVPARPDYLADTTGSLLKPACLALDFELVTASYDEDDDREADGIDDTSWVSRIAWNNYGSCHLGLSQSSNSPGIVVSVGSVPFEFDRDSYEFEADPLPITSIEHFPEVATFGIYLLGHDAVAGHRIRLHSRQSDGSYSLDWTGRVMLTYSGASDGFEHEFVARLTGVRFDSISMFYYDIERARDYLNVELDPTISPRDTLARFVADPDAFDFEKRDPQHSGGVLHAVRRYPNATLLANIAAKR